MLGLGNISGDDEVLLGGVFAGLTRGQYRYLCDYGDQLMDFWYPRSGSNRPSILGSAASAGAPAAFVDSTR